MARRGLYVAGAAVVAMVLAASSRSARQNRESQIFSPPYAVGPQADITCPVGALKISTDARIQAFVDSNPGDTTFCLKTGTHRIARAITPKTGNVFVGEKGAILDGTAWRTSDPNDGAFRAHNEDIDEVTIRNLVIVNMPQKGIHAFFGASSNWTIEYNEISANGTGVNAPDRSVVRNNYIHHNRVGGYSAFHAVDTTFESNEITNNGGEQKIVGATNVTFRNNFVHHNAADGIWYDADNTGAVIEANYVDDNGREGISYEVSGSGVIRENTVRRNATTGIFIATSKDVDIHSNTVADNFRGIQYFLNCDAVGGGNIGFDLANNNAHDNRVIVPSKNGAYANGFAHLSNCTSSQVAPYLNGSKNLRFETTTYTVPSTVTKYWFWGLSGLKSWTESLSWGPSSVKSWTEWQALGHDRAGVLSQ